MWIPSQLAEDVAAHVRVPAARLVAEVDSGLQQLFEACLWHLVISLVLGESPRRPCRDPASMPVRIRFGSSGGWFPSRRIVEGRAAQAARAASSAAARSAGSSELKLSRSPLTGWAKASRWAWRNWRSRP